MNSEHCQPSPTCLLPSLSWTIPPDYLPDFGDSEAGAGETTTEGGDTVHVAGVEVTVGHEEVTSITAAVEEIEPTPSITMSSTDIMEFGEKLYVYVICKIYFNYWPVTSNHKH